MLPTNGFKTTEGSALKICTHIGTRQGVYWVPCMTWLVNIYQTCVRFNFCWPPRSLTRSIIRKFAIIMFLVIVMDKTLLQFVSLLIRRTASLLFAFLARWYVTLGTCCMRLPKRSWPESMGLKRLLWMRDFSIHILASKAFPHLTCNFWLNFV